MTRRMGFLAVSLAGLFAAVPCPARTITVALDGSGEYTTIQAAIDAAVNGDEVVVADGVYTGPGNRDIEFKGKAITVKSANGPAACIIDCQSPADDPHCGFLILSDDAKIDGLTVINGRPKEDPRVPGLDAGGIYVHFPMKNIALTNCVITHNEGYGVEWHADDSVISYCTVGDNGSYGVMFGGSGGKMRRVTATGNSVGIYCNNETAVIENCTATHNGIGIKVYCSYALVTGCYIAFNINLGIDLDYISPTVQRCRIVKNKGRGIWATNGQATIVDCLIAENEGSGIEAWAQTYVYHCTIANNHAENNGGGIFVDDCTVRDCIIAGNTARNRGDQLYIEDKGEWFASRFTISECLLQGGRSEVYEGIAAVVNWGGGVIDADPNFAFAGDYHLWSSSVCIDKGPSSSLGGGSYNVYDLDGNDRTMSKSGGASGRSDFGAYEYCGNKPTIAVSTENLTFQVPLNDSQPREQVIALRNCGGAVLNWQTLEDCDWLEVSPESGTLLPDEAQAVTIAVAGESLERGGYTYNVRFVDDNASNSPRRVGVTLNINSTRRVPQEYGTIQEALDDAVDGDVVLVADGVYRGYGNRDLNMKGKAVRLQSENGPRHCVVDCQAVPRDQHIGISFVSKEGQDSILDGFSIMNGVLYGIYCKDSSPHITNCILFGNVCALYSWGGATVVDNCLVVGNVRAGPYGAVVVVAGSMSVFNSTVAYNTTGHYGGGIVNAGELTLINSIVWGNRDRTGAGRAAQVRDVSGAPSRLYYNCIQGWSPADPNGVGNFSGDPRFLDPLDGDFHLQADSPCIGVGDPNGTYLEGLLTDFEGDWRQPGKRVDIGADRFVSYDFDGDGHVNLWDFGSFAEHWQEESCAQPDWCGLMDFNFDGTISWPDLLALGGGWPEKTARSNYLVAAHWSFDDISGTSALDESPFARQGMLVNVGNEAWLEGKVGGGLALDGVDGFVRITGWKGVDGGRSRTCCAWIKTADTAGQIISWGTTGVGVRWNLVTEGGGRLRLEVGGGAIVGSKVICDGQWHYVAAVLDNDGTPNVNEVKLYVDGVEDTPSSAGDVGVNTETDPATAPDVRIGVWLSSPQYFAGKLDEVRIYERALSAEEVWQLAQ